jgi:hypothetical protein
MHSTMRYVNNVESMVIVFTLSKVNVYTQRREAIQAKD